MVGIHEFAIRNDDYGTAVPTVSRKRPRMNFAQVQAATHRSKSHASQLCVFIFLRIQMTCDCTEADMTSMSRV